jgi:hypothetical protein
MPILQQQIAEKFLASLSEREDIDAAQVDELRALLGRGKRPKAEDFIQVFTMPRGGVVK